MDYTRTLVADGRPGGDVVDKLDSLRLREQLGMSEDVVLGNRRRMN